MTPAFTVPCNNTLLRMMNDWKEMFLIKCRQKPQMAVYKVYNAVISRSQGDYFVISRSQSLKPVLEFWKTKG